MIQRPRQILPSGCRGRGSHWQQPWIMLTMGMTDFIYLFKRFLPLPKKYFHFSSHETITWYLRRSRQAESRTEPVPPLENSPMVKNNARVTLCIWNIWDACSTVALKPSSMDPWVECFCLFAFPSEFSYHPVSSHNACSDYLEALWIDGYLDNGWIFVFTHRTSKSNSGANNIL